MGIRDLFNKLRGKENESLSPFSLSEEIVETNAQEEPQPSNIKEGDVVMERTSNYATGKAIATGQITLVDLTDIISQPTAPTSPKENMLWMDTSKTPPVLMVYKSGKWVKENDFKEDPQYKVITETMKKNTEEIAVNKGNISLKVSASEATNIAVTEIGKVQIGGTNLLPGTSKNLQEVTFGGWDYYFPKDLVNWAPGEKITGKVFLKPTNQNASCMLHVRYADSTYWQTRGTRINAGSQGYSTVSITIPNRTDIVKIQFSIRHDAGDTPSDKVYYKEAKVEKGTKNTDWSPAPEDAEQKFSNISDKFSKIDATLESLDLEVGSITTADFATCNNTALEFIVGSGSGINSDIRNKVKASNIPVYVQGNINGADYLTLLGIQSLDSKGNIIDELDYGKGIILRKSKTNASIYDELTPKGVYRKINSSDGSDLAANAYYYENQYQNLIKVEPLGKLKIECNLTSVSTKHIVPLSTMASIENAVSSIEISKNQISQKVNVNDVIAAINMGIEDDESNILIMADRVKLKGSITIEALDKGLQEGYIYDEEAGKTMINGGFISAKSLELSKSMQANGVQIVDKNKVTTFSVDGDSGLVNIKGNVQSTHFKDPVYDSNGNMTTVGVGWKIESDGTAIFNEGEFRSKVVLPRAGMSNEGNVRIWAGDSIPSAAPFRVMDNGDIYVSKGNFAGVFSGDVKVGGITISDNPVPGQTGRSRAVIEIRNDNEQVVTTLADDSAYIGTTLQVRDVLQVNESYVHIKKGGLNVGDASVVLDSNNSSISFKNGLATFKASDSQVDFTVNGTSQSTDFVFSNTQRDTVVEIQGQLKVKSNVDIGIVTIRKTNDGLDFLFI